MQALILAGGEGTRLRPLTYTVPKPVIPLVDRPFIRYMIDWLARHGVDEVVLACGFMAAALREVLGDGEPGGPRLRYVEEPEPRGTAGAIKFAAAHLGERFLALNGDVLSDLDLGALIRFHEERGSAVTLGLYPVTDATGYGLVTHDADGQISEFHEKPDPQHSGAGEINAGTYVLERSIIDLIPSDREVSIEREIFPQLVGAGLHGLRLEGYWMDIGTPERYLQASWDILERRVKSDASVRLDARGRLIDHEAQVAADAVIADSVLVDAGAQVDEAARIGPRAVLGPGSHVGAGARVHGAVLLEGSEVADGASLRAAIVGPGARVGASAELEPNTIVGAGDRVGV